MTDRVHSFQVVLEEDIRIDDIELVVNALRMVKGVLAVEPIVTDFAAAMAEVRAKDQMREKLITLVKEMRAEL